MRSVASWSFRPPSSPAVRLANFHSVHASGQLDGCSDRLADSVHSNYLVLIVTSCQILPLAGYIPILQPLDHAIVANFSAWAKSIETTNYTDCVESATDLKPLNCKPLQKSLQVDR